MPGVADDDAESALTREVDGGLDVCWGGGVDGVERDVAELAGSCRLARGVVDYWAFVVGVVLERDRLGADKGRIGEVGDEGGALVEILLWTWVAGDGRWLGLDQAAVDGLVETVPGRGGWPAVVLWTLRDC